MALLARLHQKVVARLEQLITEGRSILDDRKTQVVDYDAYGDAAAAGLGSMQGTYEAVDEDRFHEWQTNWGTLLGQVLPAGDPRRADIGQLARSSAELAILREMLAILRGCKSDYDAGFFDDLSLVVRAEVAGDYMAQAEVLLAEEYHVPAAVLAGAVLEDALRKLCDGKGILVTKPSGERKGINAMNDDLGRASVYNAAKADEIRAWAKYRNDCAHGDGAKVKPEDVGRMVQGVRAFVADHLS